MRIPVKTEESDGQFSLSLRDRTAPKELSRARIGIYIPPVEKVRGIGIAYDLNGTEHYRDLTTGRLISNIAAMNSM